jgi:sorting nexin-3/12
MLLETSITKTFSKNSKYTLYEINCITNLPTKKSCFSKIYKRYSEFLGFHNKIKKIVKDVPPFPKKKYDKMNHETISLRKIMFDNYLRYFCLMVSSESVSKECKEILVKFLNLDYNEF